MLWAVFALDTGDTPLVDLTASGWQSSRLGTATGWGGAFAKVVVADDISAPPDAVVGPTNGAAGYWRAYTPSAAPTSIAIARHVFSYTNAAAPADQLIDAGGVAGPLAVASMATATAAPTIGWAGATADATDTIADQLGGSAIDLTGAWKSYDSGETGDDITISKPDQGNQNSLGGFYVTLTP